MITSQQMQELEEWAVEQGISRQELMEEAGRQIFLTVKEKFDLAGRRVIIFAGPGNNGGDGLAAARYFYSECPVIVLFFGEKDKLSREALVNYDLIRKYINILKIEKKADLEKFHFQEELDYLLVDALLGTGVQGKVRDPLSLAIDYFNSLPGIKVAVDLPSGLDPDTGEVVDKFCQVDLIVCFHDLKAGLKDFRRKTVVVDIGIPRQRAAGL